MMSFSIVALPETLGSAKFIGLFPNGSPRWHEVRAQGVGGSEVGTICGLNKWESAFTLWAKKSGKISDQIPQSEPMEWGSRLESVILEKFVDSHPELEVWDDAGTWQHSADEWAHANPDGIYQRQDGAYGIIEIKTAAYPDDWQLLPQGVVGASSGVPRYYLTQVQHYLRVFGFKEAIVCALFSGNKYREYLVEADEFQQSVDRDQVLRFMSSIETGVAPDWDGSTSTYETVRVMNPEITDDEVELGDLAERLIYAHAEFGECEKALNALKSQVLDAMGYAKKGLFDGDVVVTRQAGRNGASPFLVIKKGKN
jgi:putative phage-type endonuclease